MLAMLALFMMSGQADELSRKECREGLDAFYAEPARRCSPSADEAQTAKVAATQGRRDAWDGFYEACEQEHMGFLALDQGCQDKFMEGYPNADWRDRWAKLEAIDAAVDVRLVVFGCARDRDPELTALTKCQGVACDDVVQRAGVWAERCNPETLDVEAAGVGYRKSFELLGMLSEEAAERASYAKTVSIVGESVKSGSADGLQLALASPWCTRDQSYSCGLGTEWSSSPELLIAGLRKARMGDLDHTRVGRARLTGIRDPRQRLLRVRELRPMVIEAPVSATTATEAFAPFPRRDPGQARFTEAPFVRGSWAGNERLRALTWQGKRPESAVVHVDVDPDGKQVGAVVHGDQPFAVSFEISRAPADMETALREVRAAVGEDGLVELRRTVDALELLYEVSDNTRVTYVAFEEGREAVVHKVVEHVGRAQRSAQKRARQAIDAHVASGELADPGRFSELVGSFGDGLDGGALAEAIGLHVGLVLATGDMAAAQRRLEQLAPQLDLWNERWQATSEPIEEVEDPELVDPDVDTRAPSPRSRLTGTMEMAIGGCAETVWAEAAESAHADAKRWHHEAVWFELELAYKQLRGEDAVHVMASYRFAMRSLAEAIRVRHEAGRLAGETDKYRLKSGMSRIDTTNPVFWLAAETTKAECL